VSLEMILFLEKSRIPERAALQNAVEYLGLPFQFYAELDLVNDSGFSPSTIKGASSGFEIYSQSAQEVLPSYPQMRETVGARDWTITLRWGSRMSECACVLAASAAMVEHCDAVAYYPADDLTYTLKTLVDEFQGCLKRI
jgi:hypothetical protein